MIVKPYSSIAADAFAAADYPACKLFLRCDEDSGNSLTDAVSQIAIATGAALGHATKHAVSFANGVSASDVALPSAITVGTKSALLFAVVNTATGANLSLGTAGLAKLLMGSLGMSAGDGTNTASAAALSVTGAIVGGGTAFVSGAANEATKYESTLTTYATASATAAPGDLTNLGNITQITALGSIVGNYDLYGMALFVFDNGLPADIKAAQAWMTAQWQRGNKAIYPGWKGLA